MRPWHQRGLDTVPLAVLGSVRLDSPSLGDPQNAAGQALSNPTYPVRLAML